MRIFVREGGQEKVSVVEPVTFCFLFKVAAFPVIGKVSLVGKKVNIFVLPLRRIQCPPVVRQVTSSKEKGEYSQSKRIGNISLSSLSSSCNHSQFRFEQKKNWISQYLPWVIHRSKYLICLCGCHSR